MNEICSTQGAEMEWQEAHDRVAVYLRALNLTRAEASERIISEVLQRAAAKHAQYPWLSPTNLAMNEMRGLMERWLDRLFGSRERVTAAGMVSLFAIDAAQKWPEAFLAEEIPNDFKFAVWNCEVSAAPGLRVTSMVPQPFESPLSDLNLPTALGQLTRDLSPSFVAKSVAFILSGFAFLFGSRMR